MEISCSKVAAALGLSKSAVSQWLTAGGRVPAERSPFIERFYAGQVTCEEMRPDIAWHRVADPEWPWHPAGRPLIDVTRQVTTTTQETRNAA